MWKDRVRCFDGVTLAQFAELCVLSIDISKLGNISASKVFIWVGNVLLLKGVWLHTLATKLKQ